MSKSRASVKMGLLAAYGVLFFFFDTQATAFEVAPGVSLWYPSAGLNLALVVLIGAPAAVPAILTATLASGLLISEPSLPFAQLIGPNLIVAAAYGTAGAWMRHRLEKWRPVSRSPLIAQIAVLCLLLPAVVATLSVLLYTLAGTPGYSWSTFTDTAFSWWLADAVGILTLMPILLVGLWGVVFPQSEHISPKRLLGLSLRGNELLEFIGQLATVPVALYTAFFLFPLSGPHYYLCLLPVLWMAHRARFSRATLGIFLTTVGAFLLLSYQNPLESVRGFQLFVLVLCLAGYVVGSRESERQRALQHLQGARNKLRERLSALADVLDVSGDGYAPVPEETFGEETFGESNGSLTPDATTLTNPFDATEGRAVEATRLNRYIDQIEDGQELLAQFTDRLVASEQQLRLTGARKDQFFTNVSHELRTPLTLIIGPLEDALAGAHGPLPPPLRHRHRLMLRNARRLLRFVNQLLDLARLDAGHLRLKTNRQDFVLFIERLVETFEPIAERRNVKLTCEPDVERCPLYFDPHQMEQAAGNVLSNALKFTPAGGSVSVVVTRSDEHARVVVQDSGPGIPAQQQQQIFERFYRSEEVPEEDGTGIGLALTRELVQLHGGRVEIESEMGAGSTFILHLPTGRAHLSDDQVTEQAPAEPAAGVRPNDSSFPDSVPEPWPAREATDSDESPSHVDCQTVLVVDDNANLRTYVRSVLSSTYRVLEASDGAEGLSKAKKHLPDLILSDVSMPKTDGFELVRQIRDDPATTSIPVVLLTARATDDDELTGLLAGADDYLRKPFAAKLLWARVGNLMARQHRLRERLQAEHPDGTVRTGSDEAAHGPDENPDDDPDPASEPAVSSDLERQVRKTIGQHLSDSDFSVEELADEMALSRSHLSRKLKRETGHTPTDLIRQTRLERGAELLAERSGTISEVAYAVGFNSLSYFSRCFRERFGVPPSQYVDDSA